MFASAECSKGYRFPKVVISYAVYLYHRFCFPTGTCTGCCSSGVLTSATRRFVSDVRSSALTLPKRYVVVSPGEAEAGIWTRCAVVLGGVTKWLWRAVNEYGDVLDVLLQKNRDTCAATRFFRRLIDDHELPERIVTDGLKSYGAALRELPELDASEHVIVSAAERQNMIEQSHRPTREHERQQRGFRVMRRAQRFLFTHAEVGNLFHPTRTEVTARLRHHHLTRSFSLWAELSLAMP